MSRISIGGAAWSRWMQARVPLQLVQASRSRAEGAGEQPAGGGLEDVDLDELTYAQLKDLAKAEGLPYSNRKKVDLIEALEALRALRAANAAASAAQEAEEAEEEYEEGEAGEVEEDPIKEQLREMSVEEIVEILEGRGEDTSGDHEELVDRLATILAPELERELQMEAEGGSGGGGEQQGAGFEVDDATRERLVAFRAAQIKTDLAAKTRQQLYSEVKKFFPNVNYGTREALASSLSSSRAQEEVDQAVQRAQYSDEDAQQLRSWLQAMDGPAEVAEEDTSEVLVTDRDKYENMSVSEIRKLRVGDLRDALTVLGQPADGNRYEMMERLVAYRQARLASDIVGSVSSADGLQFQIQEMSLRDMRLHLVTRGLNASGTRPELEERLYAAMLKDARPVMQERAEEAAAVGDVDVDAEVWDLAMADMDLRAVTTDPNVTIAIVCGAPGGDLEAASASVAAARGVLEALHTAPLPRLAPAAEADPGDKAALAEDEIVGPADWDASWRPSATGVSARVFYVDRSGATLRELTPPQLLAAGSAAAVEVASTSSSEDFASVLRGSGCGAVLPILSGLPSSAMLTDVSKRLHGAGLPCVGLPPGDGSNGGASDSVALLASDKWRLVERLRDLGYPTVPTYYLGPEDEQEPAEERAQRISNWCTGMGGDPHYQQLVVKPARGARGYGMTVVSGTANAAAVAASVLEYQQQWREQQEGKEQGAALDAGGGGVVLQPWMGRAVQFSCLVVEGPAGPLALLPTEVELEDVDDALLDNAMDWHTWELQQEGVAADAIDQEIREMRATVLPSPEFKTFDQTRAYLPNQTVRYHCPPRLPRKVIHHIRHAAAKLFTQLGARDVARVSGWVVPEPGWQERYKRAAGDVPLLLDPDAEIVQRAIDAEAKELESDPLPLHAYYDDCVSHAADLSAFDPSARLDASRSGGEASILISNLHVGSQLLPDLSPSGLAAAQAAELGMSHSSLLRCVLNSALRRGAGSSGAASSSGGVSEAAGAGEAALAAGTAAGGEPETSASGPLQLGPVPVSNVYGSAPLLSSAPDTWHLLSELREQKAEDAMEEVGRGEEIDEELEDMEDTLRLLNDDLGGALKENDEIDALGEGADEQLQYEDPELSVRLVDRWEPGEDEVDEAVPEPADCQGDEEPSRNGLSAPPGSVLALKQQYPDLDDDAIMRLFVGETRTGFKLDRDGFVAVCRQGGPGASGALESELEQVQDVLEMMDEGEEQEWEEDEEGEEAEGEGEGEAGARAAGEGEQEEEAEAGAGAEGGPAEGEEAESRNWTDHLPAEVRQEMLDLGMPPTASDAEGLPRPVRVWVLMGGDPSLADASLRSGLEVVRRLSQFSDLQVEPFFIAPAGSGADERRRRAELLKQRNEWLSHGAAPGKLPDFLQVPDLRNMPHPEVCLESEHVWALTPAVALQASAESVVDACERALQLANTSQPVMGKLEAQALEARWDTQMELQAGGLQGVGELWGGAYDAEQPVPPRLLSLGQFADEASDNNALVFIATRGEVGGHDAGTLQRFLDMFGVAYTGSGTHAAWATGDRLTLAESLLSLENRGVSSPPTTTLPAGVLFQLGAQDDETAVAVANLQLQQARAALLGDADSKAPLAVMPSLGGGGAALGLARIDSPSDFATYARAVYCAHPFIPANALSVPHPFIRLPRHCPETFLVQPFVETDPVYVRPAAAASSDSGSTATTTAASAGTSVPQPHVEWAGEQRWVQVTIGLLGLLGHMTALGPSLTATLHPDLSGKGALASAASAASPAGAASGDPSEGSTEGTAEGAEGGVETRAAGASAASQPTSSSTQHVSLPWPSEVVHLSPVPAAVAGAAAQARARQLAVQVADWLGLSGLVRLDGFMHVDSGELVVSGVDAAPDLSADSPLYAQALHDAEDPKYPHELLRALVLNALAASAQPRDDDGGSRSAVGEGEDEDEGLELDELAEAGYGFDAEVDQGEEMMAGGQGAVEGEQEEPEYQANWRG